MSNKRKKPPEPAIDRPFDPDLWDRARKIAEQYQIVMSFEDGEWFGRGLEMPMTMGDGKTPDQCMTSVREALTVSVAYMLENGQRPPKPARGGERTEQVNIRLSRLEKQALEEAAGNGGFRSVSDYLRVKALSV